MLQPNPWPQRTSDILAKRQQQQLLRQRRCIEAVDARTVRIEGNELLQFSSNDYLGLAFANEAISAKGAGASALVSGYQPQHRQLEQTLCEATGYEAALLFSSGFAANSAPLALVEKGDRILADKLAHASIIDAALASLAQLRRFPHNNLEVLERWLQQPDSATPISPQSQTPTIVVTESVFSMDGDETPLAEFVALCAKHKALSWVDDAHGFGVLGEHGFGAAEIAKPDLLTITFGKALGASGAALLGSQALIDAITQRCKHYIYSTAIPADLAERVTQRINGLNKPKQRQHLRQLIAYFRNQLLDADWQLGTSDTPIQPLLCDSSEQALQLADYLMQQNIYVAAIRPPTVPQPRLRFVINAKHQYGDVDRVVTALANYRIGYSRKGVTR